MKYNEMMLANFNMYSKVMEDLTALEITERELNKEAIKFAGSLTRLKMEAYPDGSDKVKADFQTFIQDKSNNSKKITSIQKDINHIKQHLSAIRYHNFIINKIDIMAEKNEKFASLYYNGENNTFSVSVVQIDEYKHKIVNIKPDDLNDFLEDFKLIFIFDAYREIAEPYKEVIKDFNPNGRDNRFITIQHLLRHKTQFTSLSIEKFKDIYNIKSVEIADTISELVYRTSRNNLKD